MIIDFHRTKELTERQLVHTAYVRQMPSPCYWKFQSTPDKTDCLIRIHSRMKTAVLVAVKCSKVKHWKPYWPPMLY